MDDFLRKRPPRYLGGYWFAVFSDSRLTPFVNSGGQAVLPAAGLVPRAHGGVLGVDSACAAGAEKAGCDEEKTENESHKNPYRVLAGAYGKT